MFCLVRPRVRRALNGALCVAVALSVSTIAATPSGAAVATAKVDKSAVLRMGVPLVEQGGVFFDPAN